MYHAGGVLADATLANQSPAAMRAAFAPKLASYQRLQGIAGLHPTAEQVSSLYYCMAHE